VRQISWIDFDNDGRLDPDEGPVDVEVVSLTKTGRATTRVAGVSSEQLPNRTLRRSVSVPVLCAPSDHGNSPGGMAMLRTVDTISDMFRTMANVTG
jgi:hypothetical protein